MVQQKTVRRGRIVCESVKTHTHTHILHNVMIGTLHLYINALFLVWLKSSKILTKMAHYVRFH